MTTLKKSLTGLQLWGLAVGLVIGGEYFGWSYGWASAGTLGFLVTTVFVTIMYVSFMFSYTELTTSIPHAGGPFAYSYRAFGPIGGLIAGFATLTEFVFAPPAVALSIAAYLNVQFPHWPPKLIAGTLYGLFTGINIIGVSIAATFELFVTVLAIAELLAFMCVVAPKFSWANFAAHGWAGHDLFRPNAIGGIMAAIPFAIWFFLAIEGAAMAAEEVQDPRRTVPMAYLAGIGTLAALAFGVMVFAGGVGDWRLLANINDPLPQAMRTVVGARSGWLHMLVAIGLFGLIASFHGIMMGYSRQIFALARAGFLPQIFSRLNKRWRTPYWATLVGGVIGMAAIFSDDLIQIGGKPLTANIVALSVFGAVILYIISMLAMIRLRTNEPTLTRSFRVPLYPATPLIALLTALICLIALVVYDPLIAVIFVGLFFVALCYYLVSVRKRLWMATDLAPRIERASIEMIEPVTSSTVDC
jgi:ethanolamine permease